MAWYVMESFPSYEAAREDFEWDLPERYNPAVDFLRKHDHPERVALRYEPPSKCERSEAERVGSSRDDHDNRVRTDTFRDLDERSDRLAAAFRELNIEAGDRVGVVVPQRPENPVTHLANWKLGAVSVPLTVLFGRDALQYRLQDSGARAVVVDPSVSETIQQIRGDCPDLEHVVELTDSPTTYETQSSELESTETQSADELARADTHPGTSDSHTSETDRYTGEADTHAFDALCARFGTGIEVYDSTPETPTALMYTSGSTGPPKGVLHSHALWLGRAAAAYNYFDQGLDSHRRDGQADPATLWTPADWAWGAALGGTLFAAWHYGCTVVGHPRRGFDPDDAFELLERHAVTHAFMPPTALRMLATVDSPADRFDLSIETFASAGEPTTPELLEWVEAAFVDVSLNEFYGQTELNLCVGNSSDWFETRPGSMGKPLPGYEVAILDTETRDPLPAGEVGEIAVRPDDRRVFFDEYWGLPEKTREKQTDDGWFLTGDLAKRDDEGYLWFVSRADDVILTRGYRVGPMEVESAILDHPAVEQVGVVGVPDETIGEAIKAFVKPTGDLDSPDRVREEIRDLVRGRLAEYEYPEYVEFVDELPTTTTGKIRRKSLREQD